MVRRAFALRPIAPSRWWLDLRASHTHVMAIGNGECVALPSNGGEEDVEMPLAEAAAPCWAASDHRRRTRR